MSYPLEYEHSASTIAADAVASERVAFIRRTYGHLAGAVLAFIAVEAVLLQLPGIEGVVGAMIGSRFSWLVVFAGFMGVSWLARSWANSNTSRGMQYLGLSLYVGAEALIFLPLLYIANTFYDKAIPTAGMLTLTVFFGLTLAVFTTRKDFSFLGPILSVGGFLILGLIVASLIFGFSLGLIFCFALVAFACAYILYDTSNILLHYHTDQHVAASLALFADVALLFWYILQIVMSRRDEALRGPLAVSRETASGWLVMPDRTFDLADAHLPRLPRRRDFRIGCVGAGFIMRDCHLVAYRQAGFNPVAIASRDPAHAQAVAAQHGIPRCHATVADLLANSAVEVLDIAVPPDVQPDIIRQAVQHRHLRGILAQKPLALTYREAKECVERCAQAGIVLAVNQNMRYDQSVRALKEVLRRGWLGEPVLGTIEMRAIPHWMPWSQGLRSLSTFIMSIHHLDTFRFWFGTPDRVLASTRPDPRTAFPHRDGINLYILEYDHGCRAAAWDDVWTGPSREGAAADIGIRWRIEGTDGLARGTIGWPSYPARTPSTLDFTTKQKPGTWLQPRWQEVWFPDAFVGTMAQLLCALEDGTEPEISGRDNLETIALCEAVYAAGQEHRVTTVREFLL